MLQLPASSRSRPWAARGEQRTKTPMPTPAAVDLGVGITATSRARRRKRFRDPACTGSGPRGRCSPGRPGAFMTCSATRRNGEVHHDPAGRTLADHERLLALAACILLGANAIFRLVIGGVSLPMTTGGTHPRRDLRLRHRGRRACLRDRWPQPPCQPGYGDCAATAPKPIIPITNLPQSLSAASGAEDAKPADRFQPYQTRGNGNCRDPIQLLPTPTPAPG